MSDKKPHLAESPDETGAGSEAPQTAAAPPSAPSRRTRLGSWIKLFLGPVLFLGAGVLLIVALGAAQKLGWISAGGGGHASSAEENVRYICPMMCTPPQSEPGRCPVCAMELVPATSESDDSDTSSIQVDPVARRVANIRTAVVKAVPLVRRVRAIGELSYDEGRMKTIAAYVDGRLERLDADYTGVVVAKGDHLALLYSPQLYSSQVELLVAKQGRERVQTSRLEDAVAARRDLYDSARQRLTEFGMTDAQIAALERTRQANSRIQLCAPIDGTVIEKLAVEGQYVKTGQPIYRLADLSTVWLMLELFPEDAAMIRDGQAVEAEVQSLPGQKFPGRVAFLDPTVDPKTRTVGVRVEMPNEEGLLRVGDYAKATIEVAVDAAGGPAEGGPALVVPRSAVLMAGESSVVYVETEPGRFQIRRVVLGPTSGDEIAILEGVMQGEQVACSGNFLIDSQMQLAGNPSLIDPTKAQSAAESDEGDYFSEMDLPSIGVPQIAESPSELPPIELVVAADEESAAVAEALSALSPSDRTLAEAQKICPVTEMPLGSMGTPIKVDVEGRPVFICCEGCRESLLAEPAKHLAKLPKEAVR